VIKHIVMWHVRGESLAERSAAARTVQHAFESLRGLIPGMRQLVVGIDVSLGDLRIARHQVDYVVALPDVATG